MRQHAHIVVMQYENSEQKYMKDLYNLNEGMETLDKNARKYIIIKSLTEHVPK